MYVNFTEKFKNKYMCTKVKQKYNGMAIAISNSPSLVTQSNLRTISTIFTKNIKKLLEVLEQSGNHFHWKNFYTCHLTLDISNSQEINIRDVLKIINNYF